MVYINIGTNLGELQANLDLALARVGARFPLVRVSERMESEPWGFESANKFLNVCACFEQGDLAPEQILQELQQIERAISPLSHRNPDGSYRDRLIDIDIVAIDGVEMHTPRLTLPHPHLQDREFFLDPYLQIRR